MSYRPNEQGLSFPLGKLIDSIREINQAYRERVDSGEWDDSHIQELHEFVMQLMPIELKAAKIKTETW